MEEKSEKIKDYLTEGRTYVQRDLEDQIKEEYERLGKKYQRVDKSNNMSTQSPAIARPVIVVQDVLNLLKAGYTRYTKDDMGYGSIQTQYQLTGVQVKELFNHSKLKAKKTILPKTGLVIVDNETSQIEEEVLTSPTTTVLEELTTRMEAAIAPKQDVLIDITEEVKKSELFS